MKLFFADTETTGTEEHDRLIQLAFKCGNMTLDQLYAPPRPINLMAMMIHHITEDDVKDEEPFIGSAAHTLLKKQRKNLVFVAHNAAFDLKMLEKEGIKFKHHICTLKVVRHLDVKAKLECHKLQYLRYLYKMDLTAEAHDAMGDVIVLEKLFWLLVKRICKVDGCSQTEAIATMLEISSVPSLILRFPFGKYKGELLMDILMRDRGYLEWLERSKLDEPEGQEDWIYTLEKLLS